MPVLSANRATIAGLGSTAALLAAVLAVSLLVGGLVAYSGSSAGPLVAGEPWMALPGSGADTPRQAAAAQPPLTLPPARPAVRVSAPQAVRGPVASDPRSAGRPESAPVTSTPAGPVGTGTGTEPAPTSDGGPPAPAAVPGLPALPVPVPTAVLPDVTASTGQALGGAVRGVLGAVGSVVATVAPRLGPPVDALGVGLGGTVTHTTDVVADVLRRLGG